MVDGPRGLPKLLEIEAPESATSAAALAQHLLAAPSANEAELTTVQLAAACAELDLIVDEEEALTKRKAVRLDLARRALAERFKAEGVSSIRVTTSGGRRLVFVTRVVAPSVVGGKENERFFEWLKAKHPELVAEDYNMQQVVGKLRTWRAAQEGEFPQELVDAGVVKVFEGDELRFRKSN